MCAFRWRTIIPATNIAIMPKANPVPIYRHGWIMACVLNKSLIDMFNASGMMGDTHMVGVSVWTVREIRLATLAVHACMDSFLEQTATNFLDWRKTATAPTVRDGGVYHPWIVRCLLAHVCAQNASKIQIDDTKMTSKTNPQREQQTDQFSFWYVKNDRKSKQPNKQSMTRRTVGNKVVSAHANSKVT